MSTALQKLQRGPVYLKVYHAINSSWRTTAWLQLLFIAVLFLLCFQVPKSAGASPQASAEALAAPNEQPAHAPVFQPEEHALSARAVEIGQVFGFPVYQFDGGQFPGPTSRQATPATMTN